MKKYTEVYLERRQVRCVLVESDVNATEQEIFEAAELYQNEDTFFPDVDYKAFQFEDSGSCNQIITDDPHKDVCDFKNWPLAKVAPKQ